MEIGERVRDLRRRRGMPIAELARRARVSRQTIHTLESGRRVSDAVMAKVAGALEAPLSTIDPGAADRIAELAAVAV